MKNMSKIIGLEEIMKMMMITTRRTRTMSRVVVSSISLPVQRRTGNTVPEVTIDKEYERPKSNEILLAYSQKGILLW